MGTKKIAIDGPSGAGKSTIAKHIAKALGYIYVDTGAMYRSVALYCLEHGIDPSCEEDVRKVIDDICIDIKYENKEQQIYLCGRNVTSLIRSAEMSMGASNVSKHSAVRSKLVSLQRNLAEKYNVVMDGRDIATRVMPDADIAIFLTADVEDRARRRYYEMKEKGEDISFENVLEDMKRRDNNDSTRANSPLVKAENAILVDTTGNTLEESINYLSQIISKKLR
ncbi:MAG: (d)CMP kinase [Bacillota bacterium]|nr:(d)CMP kinase [Bacillota bacterium]